VLFKLKLHHVISIAFKHKHVHQLASMHCKNHDRKDYRIRTTPVFTE